ncbi:MAG: hypothetical protein HGA96_03830 [Desulfobulbaceae bacterium]|nr:hypothetical protein [Desulfobulbaceae bacterium]
MSKVVGKYHCVLFFLLMHVLFFGTWCLAEEVIPLRLVAMINRDDQGEGIAFPIALYYDPWASETYLISSTGRITIYDQKFFPVASFGKGRGVTAPSGLTVDRRGSIYVCQEADGKIGKSRLTIFNQAFFPSKEIIFANIPELAEFTATKVAVAESGEIYLAGNKGSAQLSGVAVLTPDGKFLRFLVAPESNAWRPIIDKEPVVSKVKQNTDATPNATSGAAESSEIPAGLKPKSKSSKREETEERGRMEPAYIDDVKIDRQGRIYLLSREVSNIYVLNAKEEYLFKFGEKGGVHGKLSNPVSLGIDQARGVIYVCDYMRHTILCYDYDNGRYLFEFGGRGTGALWFNFPNNVEVDQRGQVVVSDLFNRRLQVIDTNMTERRPMPVQPSTPLAAVTTPMNEETALSPPGPSQPSLQGALSAPATIMPLVLPAGMVGVNRGSDPLRLPAAALALPPPFTSRELIPRLVKKSASSSVPQLKLVEFSPVPAPGQFAKPAAVRINSGKALSGKTRRQGDLSAVGGQGFQAMPAAVGVYGPVVSLVGVGSRMLSTKR